MTGKGSAPRPFSVNNETFAKNFEAIFGKKNENSSSAECSVAETNSETNSEEKGAKDEFGKSNHQVKLGG